MLAHGELSLSVPYWYDGEQAERIVPLLRDVVTRVEQVTGLTAYDPQADAAFLDAGSRSTAQVFDQVHHAMRNLHPPAPSPSASAQPTGRPWWRRLFGR
jgi:hypothetical protein